MNDTKPETLVEAIKFFSDADTCQEFMMAMRWPDGVVTCPNCGRADVRYISTRRLWECKEKHAKRQFSVKVGSIFEDSPIGLDKWLPSLWLIANDKNGISSYELARALGVTQTTAWFMLHRIRLAMQSDDYTKLDGIIEVDETFIGGKARFMHKAQRVDKIKGTGTVGKTAVMGLLERHGPDGHSTVRAGVVASRRRSTLSPQVRKNVTRGAVVYTDALPSYADLQADYNHGVIDHAEKYVDGQIHTNGIENFWSLLKRAIKGTYISVEPFHLFRYLDEETFRFNNRKATDGERFLRLARSVTGKRLTYNELIGATTTPA
ncbi:MAG TPA: IS1595 family transposase [Dehalococcoidia bacterium]|nr:IS1595 family transposase [Dehalococcoidia bacterium]